MLKSTYKPSAAATAVLPPGWSEHTAPTGHKYYYNAETKESTYQRPSASEHITEPSPSPSPYAHLPSLADPRVANAYLAQLNHQNQATNSQRGRGRGGFEGRPRPQPLDKPRRCEKIPGCEPWMLVYTKYSRRFAYNPDKNASYWRIPEKLKEGILELDKARIREKAGAGDADDLKQKGAALGQQDDEAQAVTQQGLGSDDDYEEVEVEMTDGDGDGDGDGDEEEAEEEGYAGSVDPDHQRPSKRQRTSDPATADIDADDSGDDQDGPVEFTEADIVAQLQAMGEDYGLEPGDYDDGNMEDWPEGAEGVPFSEEDAKLLFKDLLNDSNVNPYSPWDKLIEEGSSIINDARYTALATTRARKACWDEWTREKIAELKALRARQEKKDPRIAYMAFLQQKATPKLYWPEFKRKYKKEDAMKDMNLSDKDREKAYRQHVGRLKMPLATLKSDLTALLKEQPLDVLSRRSSASSLPPQVLTDVRYISLDPAVRDPLIEAYLQTLPLGDATAADGEGGDGDEERKRMREKREMALRARDRAVEEGKQRRHRELEASKARLREEQRELDAAMRVDKKGLQSQLAGDAE